MNKYSLVCIITVALFVPIAHAMEKDPINPDFFTKEGKEYMAYSVGLWVEAAQQGNITTGLAAIFENMKKEGIEHLINDSDALHDANVGLYAMMRDPVFQTLSSLQKIGTYEYAGAKQLRDDVLRVVTQAVATNVLTAVCPDFKTPQENIIQFFVAEGRPSIPECIELLKLNTGLNITQANVHIGALTLVMGYLAQIGDGY